MPCGYTCTAEPVKAASGISRSFLRFYSGSALTEPADQVSPAPAGSFRKKICKIFSGTELLFYSCIWGCWGASLSLGSGGLASACPLAWEHRYCLALRACFRLPACVGASLSLGSLRGGCFRGAVWLHLYCGTRQGRFRHKPLISSLLFRVRLD